jgi:hypothetical protein
MKLGAMLAETIIDMEQEECSLHSYAGLRGDKIALERGFALMVFTFLKNVPYAPLK